MLQAPIIWISELQSATATSTTEAGFCALATIVPVLLGIRSILPENGSKENSETVIKQENLGIISRTEEVKGLRKIKHVVIKYYYVRDQISNKSFKVIYSPLDKNRADYRTKILGK